MSDLINRQAAINAIDSESKSTNPSEFFANERFIEFMDNAETASFGKWKFANGFVTALSFVRVNLKQLPSAEPERKTGRWIYSPEALPGSPYGHYDCDQCDEHVPYESNYCPNCGAKMQLSDKAQLSDEVLK